MAQYIFNPDLEIDDGDSQYSGSESDETASLDDFLENYYETSSSASSKNMYPQKASLQKVIPTNSRATYRHIRMSDPVQASHVEYPFQNSQEEYSVQTKHTQYPVKNTNVEYPPQTTHVEYPVQTSTLSQKGNGQQIMKNNIEYKKPEEYYEDYFNVSSQDNLPVKTTTKTTSKTTVKTATKNTNKSNNRDPLDFSDLEDLEDDNESETDSESFEEPVPVSKPRAPFKPLVKMTGEELKQLKNPIKRIKYDKNAKEAATTKKNYNERYNEDMECETCGKVFKRKNRAAHRRTKYHQMYEEVNKRMRDFLWDPVKTAKKVSDTKSTKKIPAKKASIKKAPTKKAPVKKTIKRGKN